MSGIKADRSARARKLARRNPTVMRLATSNPQGWSWGSSGGARRLPPSLTRERPWRHGAGKPVRVACHRLSASGGGSWVSGPADPTGAGRLDA